MELEAADAVPFDQPLRGADTVGAAGRIDRGERDQHVGVRGGDLGDLLVRDRWGACDRLAVDAEDHGREVALAVVDGNVLRRRQAIALEVLRGAGAELG